MTMTDQYRVDEYGKIYEYSAEHGAFLFVGKKLPNETDDQSIQRIEEQREAARMNMSVEEHNAQNDS